MCCVWIVRCTMYGYVAGGRAADCSQAGVDTLDSAQAASRTSRLARSCRQRLKSPQPGEPARLEPVSLSGGCLVAYGNVPPEQARGLLCRRKHAFVMSDNMSRNLASFGWITTVVMSLGICRWCPADMIVLDDGKTRAGRITWEDMQSIRMNTGSSSGKRKLTISRDKIKRIVRGIPETDLIDKCKDGSRLGRWATAYFHAGLEDRAERCVRRAYSLDATVGRKPKVKGVEASRAFWNRTVLQLRSGSLADQDAAGLFKAARWAHDAGLEDETSQYVRRAWRADRSSERIRDAAANWGVRLDPWMQLDLTSALDRSLFGYEIRDDGVKVEAEPDKTFLLLPLRYDAAAGPRSLSKNSFRGKHLRGFYGFQNVPVRRGLPQFGSELESQPVYERLELQAGARSHRSAQDEHGRRKVGRPLFRPELVAKNTAGPRRIVDGETKRDRAKNRTRTVPATGWIQMIVEIPESTNRLTLEWPDGTEEALDLRFLRRVRDGLSSSIYAASERAEVTYDVPRDVAAVVGKLSAGSHAVASLAVRRLADLQAEAGRDAGAGWLVEVDAAVISVGARREEDVKSATWAYFSNRESISQGLAANLGDQPAQVHKAWIAMIHSHVANIKKTKQPVSVRLLGGILRSNNESVCDAAFDVLLELGPTVDWGLFEDASEAAKAMALIRIEDITDRDSARRLLQVLMKDARAEAADRIAAEARRLDMGVHSPADPLLQRWTAASSTAERVGALQVLGGMSLGDVVYSRRFAEIIGEATSDKADAPVRQAAFEMLVRQARLQPTRPRGGVKSGDIYGGFPLMISSKARDPFVDGLAKAAQDGTEQTRVDALGELLLMGYAEKAEAALITGARSDEERDSVLRALLGRGDVVGSSLGLIGMLGRMLRPEYESSMGKVFTHLSDIWAQTPTATQWQVLAAVKSGVDFQALGQLSLSLPPTKANAVMRWLRHTGHLTPQDWRRLAGTTDVHERVECLKRIDFRRGYLVDGRYGALAIVETVVADRSHDDPDDIWDDSTGHYRWNVPRRITVALPPLDLKTSDADDSYLISWGDEPIGQGKVKSVEGLLLPVRFSPRMEEPAERLLGNTGWGWPDPTASMRTGDRAAGPVLLGQRPVSPMPPAGTMTLDIGPCLKAALRDGNDFDDTPLDDLVPTPFEITLRYAAFGSFYGAGQRRDLPTENMPVGHRHLLNVMLVLERMDTDRRFETSASAGSTPSTSQTSWQGRD